MQVSDTLPDDQFVLLINEIPTTSGRIVPGRIYAQVPPPRLLAAGVDPGRARRPCPRRRDRRLARGRRSGPRLDAAQIRYFDAATVFGRSLTGVLARNADEFIGLQEVKFLLAETEKSFPDLVAEVNRAVPLQRLTEVLKRLVEEGISIRNMRDILEAMLDWSPREKDSVLLTEHVRNALARQLTYQVSQGRPIPALTFSAGLEELVRGGVRVSAAGNYLALDPNVIDSAAPAHRAGRSAPSRARRPQQPVVLVSMDIRRYVRHLLAPEMPDVPVLAYQNLTPTAQLKAFATLDP